VSVEPSDSAIVERLLRFVTSRLRAEESTDVNVRIEEFRPASTGRSRDNWMFDAVWRRLGAEVWNRETLIARRDPEGGLLETDRAVEFEILQALTKSNLPTPAPRWLDATGEELGRPSLVMLRLPGTCDYYALNGAASLAQRVNLAERLCTLMGNVHAVDWQAIGLGSTLTDPGPWASKAALAEWEAVLRRDQLEPYPELALAAQWLREHAPRSPRTVLVHADFKVGNVLTEDGNIVALLDWELAHLGDPHEDLGWVTQPLRKREHFIPDAWERRELLEHYQEASGHDVDHDAVLWWNVFAGYKTAVMQASGLRAFVEGRSDDFYQPSAPVLHVLLDQVLA
jgi:aminoglycoside phosphotransferase (APT) family kinase protein